MLLSLCRGFCLRCPHGSRICYNCAMEEIDFESDSFEDIVAKDGRYHARAYAVLMDVVRSLDTTGKHFSAIEILDLFKERVLDQYGPLSYTVLSEWGLKSCEDIGEMMFNLAEGRRVSKDNDDSIEHFTGGYDFSEVFLGPFAI